MATIVGVSGSLRRGSYNSALLRAAGGMMPPGSTLVTASIAAFPLYNGDDEAANGIPQAVQTLKDMIADADGLLFVTPEYNNSIPGVAKNAIDWLSRPAADIARVFGGKAGRRDRRVPGRVRHHSVAKRMAAGVPNPRCRLLGRWTHAGIPRRNGVRQQRESHRRAHPRGAGPLSDGVCSVCAEARLSDRVEDAGIAWASPR